MAASNHRPVLIVIAGPNGSGKTSVTSEILHHEWLQDSEYINRIMSPAMYSATGTIRRQFSKPPTIVTNGGKSVFPNVRAISLRL